MDASVLGKELLGDRPNLPLERTGPAALRPRKCVTISRRATPLKRGLGGVEDDGACMRERGTVAEDVLNPAAPLGRPSLSTVILLGVAVLLAAWFLATAAAPYLSLDPRYFGGYWPRRGWLLTHIAGGFVALVIGPVQIWLGTTRTRMPLHRALGLGYLAGVATGCTAAVVLALRTEAGWVFGLGLLGLATAWAITTTVAYVSIRHRVISQHREWMIRSYVVTFAFVNFRLFTQILEVAGVGTRLERATAASWFCWAIPLLVAEPFLQWRKLAHTD